MQLCELFSKSGTASAFNRNASKAAASVIGAHLTPELRPGWKPLKGPQTDAMKCEADILFYGGQGGGGKTDLQIGVSLTQHFKSILFRREYPQLSDVELRLEEIFQDGTGRYIGQKKRAITSDGRLLELGHCQLERDKFKHKGKPHDCICIDEVTEFTESQFRFLIGWLRTNIPGQESELAFESPRIDTLSILCSLVPKPPAPTFSPAYRPGAPFL